MISAQLEVFSLDLPARSEDWKVRYAMLTSKVIGKIFQNGISRMAIAWNLIRTQPPVLRVVRSEPCKCQGFYRIRKKTFRTRVYCGSCRLLLVIIYHLWPM